MKTALCQCACGEPRKCQWSLRTRRYFLIGTYRAVIHYPLYCICVSVLHHSAVAGVLAQISNLFILFALFYMGAHIHKRSSKILNKLLFPNIPSQISTGQDLNT